MSIPALLAMLPKWSHIPWKPIDFSTTHILTNPSFFMVEILFFLLSALTFIHASSRGRNFMLLWLSSTLSGVMNDIIFMFLPEVDTFWHSQASVMITPRLPLYILCVYNCFLYFGTAIAWEMNLPRFPESAMSGLLSISFYAIFDVVGAQNLWWTWHNSDNNSIVRVVGVPIASTMWVIVFSACHAFLLHPYRHNDNEKEEEKMGKGKFIYALGFVMFLSVPLMMVAMMVLGCISTLKLPPPPPISMKTLQTTVSVLIAMILFHALNLGSSSASSSSSSSDQDPDSLSTSSSSIGKGKGRSKGSLDLALDPFKNLQKRKEKALKTIISVPRVSRLLVFCILMYFTILGTFVFYADPATVRSKGVHQPLGPCGATEMDFTGLERKRYVCQSNVNENPAIETLYTLDDIPGNRGKVIDWYTVYGTPADDVWRVKASLFLLIGAMMYLVSFIVINRLSKAMIDMVLKSKNSKKNKSN